MKLNRPAYHHGNLRRALLDAAIAFLDKGDVTGLTIQAVGQAAGVSPGAPYHHFENKTALLAALAEEGFDLLFGRLTRIPTASLSPAKRLAAFGQAYLNFAESHHSHYSVMFLPDLEDRERFSSMHASAGKSLDLLLGTLAAVQPTAARDILAARAVAVWSLFHGFAALRQNGVLRNIPGFPSLTTLEGFLISSLEGISVSPGRGTD